MTHAITVTNLTLTYHRHPVVHHVNGVFERGSLTAIIGPNGAGKSTLLKGLLGWLPANQGSVVWHHLAKRDIAYLPQQATLERDFPISVIDTVLLGNWRKSGWFGGVNRDARARAEAALAEVGLAGFGVRNVQTLSTGQFQRVLFARLLLQNAPLILLDEPFTAIDAKTTADLLAIVQRWQQEGRTVICVLHDFEQVRQFFPQALLLAKTCIAWGPTNSVLSPANLSRANAMAASWDDHAAVCSHPEGPISPAPAETL